MTPPAILFVDDEPITRRISVRLLGLKYPTLEAGDVDQALEIIRGDEFNIGVLITDMRMPGKDGMILISEVSNQFEKISIIASTGDLTNYDFTELIEKNKIYAALEKPWDKKDALEIIEGAMQAFNKFNST